MKTIVYYFCFFVLVVVIHMLLNKSILLAIEGNMTGEIIRNLIVALAAWGLMNWAKGVFVAINSKDKSTTN